MKEKMIKSFLVLSILIGLLLAIIFVYNDLKKEIEYIKTNSNNDIFIEDRIYYQEELGKIQNKLDLLNEKFDNGITITIE